MLDVSFSPDRTRPEPLYRQLSNYLQGLIETDRLSPGLKLPATRELAVTLGLNRNTVVQAYEELLAQNFVRARVGEGTFVSDRRAQAVPPVALADGAQPSRSFVWPGLFAHRVRSLAIPQSFLAPGAASIRFDFRGGRVADDALPVADLRKAFTRALDYRLPELAAHLDPFGWFPLRREVARYLVNRGIACDSKDVAIVSGAQQALDLTARVLIDPGDTVVLEQPGYFGAAFAFTACQANVIGIGTDGEGLRTDELARVLRTRRVKLVYTTPAAQSPTGVVMSKERRRELLALADEHQTPVFEDDYDSELRYGNPPIAALKSQDTAGQVIYTGTFSKVLFSGLRVGYVVAAPALLEKMVFAHWNAEVATAVLEQAALADLLESGALERHLRRMRKLYAERLDAMLAALPTAMPSGVQWTQPGGGHSVWVTLPPMIDGDALFRAALDSGIAYTRGGVFHFDGRERGTLALSFATHTPNEIAEGVALLGALVNRDAELARTRKTNDA